MEDYFAERGHKVIDTISRELRIPKTKSKSSPGRVPRSYYLFTRNSLLLLDEDAHLEHRRLLLPAFHGERLKLLTGLMAELTERELDRWPTGETVALHPHLQRLTLEIILRAVFGLEQGERLDELRAALTGVLAISESPVSLMLPTFERWAPWLGDDAAAAAAAGGHRRADPGAGT